MRAVHVGVGHDDDLVVAELLGVEVRRAMPAPSAVMSVRISAEASILSRRAFSTFRILPRSGRIAWERAVAAPAWREPPAESPSTMKSSRERGILLLAVGELPGQRRRVERALAPDELARLARGLAGAGRLDDLLDDLARDARVLLEVRSRASRRRPAATQVFDLGGDELVLRLRRELRVADLDRDDGGQPLAAVVARRALVSLRAFVSRSARRTSGRAGQRGLEALEVRAAVPVVDRVREREERLGVAVVPLQRDLDPLLVGVPLRIPVPPLTSWKKIDLVVDRLLVLFRCSTKDSMPPS